MNLDSYTSEVEQYDIAEFNHQLDQEAASLRWAAANVYAGPEPELANYPVAWTCLGCGERRRGRSQINMGLCQQDETCVYMDTASRDHGTSRPEAAGHFTSEGVPGCFRCLYKGPATR